MSIMEKYIDTDEVRVYYDVFAKDNPEVFNAIFLEFLSLIR